MNKADFLVNNNVKVSYYLSHPIQYFAPLLKKLAEHLDLKVYYFSDTSIKGNWDRGFGQNVKWDTPLLEGYPYKFLKNISKNSPSSSHGFFKVINPGLINCLIKDNSSIIIINGWSFLSYIIVIIIGKILGKKIWLRAESPFSQEFRKSKRNLLFKKIVLKFLLFKFIDKFLYIGSENRKFLEYYGVPTSKLIYTPYSVNNSFFDSQYKILKDKINLLKQELNLPANKIVILFSGKYVTQKRPLDLLRAYKFLNDSNVALVMVGEGELRGAMEGFIHEYGLTNVYLTGFINQLLISKYYMIANVFVMCSGLGETWGLSVNEAMNFAKPVVVTDTCGCSSDLVEHGGNGYIVEEGNIVSLAGYLKDIIQNETLAKKMGERSKIIIQGYSNSTITNNILKAMAATH